MRELDFTLTETSTRSLEGERIAGSRPASVTQPDEERPNPELRIRGNHVIRKSGQKLVLDTRFFSCYTNQGYIDYRNCNHSIILFHNRVLDESLTHNHGHV